MLPKYRKHKRKTGDLAFVELKGRRIYLGKFNSPESKEKYKRVIAEWMMSGDVTRKRDVTIVEMIAAYWNFAEKYYQNSRELSALRSALRPLKELYALESANNFGPKDLKIVREQMIGKGWTRKNINKSVSRIKRVFRWATEEEIINSNIWHGLQAVAGLRRGKTAAKESEPVKPVSDEIIENTLPFLTPTLQAMVQVQRLTGMRPSEICNMRGCDIDITEDVWIYRPFTYKTQHLDIDCERSLGPKAQKILKPYLKVGYLFSPAQSEAERLQAVHEKRKTPLSCGNKPGSNRRPNPTKKPGDHYSADTYRRAIRYACKKAGQHWNPYQLRHTLGTEVRKHYGLEAAQAVLGHARCDVTQIYAEKNKALAREVAKKIG